MKGSLLPEKDFWSSECTDGVRMLLFEATKKRASANSEDQSHLIEKNKEFVESFDMLLSLKSKQKCLGYID